MRYNIVSTYIGLLLMAYVCPALSNDIAPTDTVMGHNYNEMCGVTSTYLALSLENKSLKLQNVIEQLRPTNNGVTIGQICRYCKTLNVQTQVTALTYNQLKEIPSPVILLADDVDSLRDKPRISHFVVCLGKHTYIKVLDAPSDPYAWQSDDNAAIRYPAILLNPAWNVWLMVNERQIAVATLLTVSFILGIILLWRRASYSHF